MVLETLEHGNFSNYEHGVSLRSLFFFASRSNKYNLVFLTTGNGNARCSINRKLPVSVNWIFFAVSRVLDKRRVANMADDEPGSEI